MTAILPQHRGGICDLILPDVATRRVLNILVAFDRRSPHAGDLLRGVGDYARTKPWRLTDFFSDRPFDAVIGDGSKAPPGLPTVRVHAGTDPADVWPDLDAVGRMAAEHFLDRGFRQFACRHGDPSAAAFAARVQAAGHDPPARIDDTFDVSALPTPLAALVEVDTFAQLLLQRCQAAGRRVPEDVAVLTVGDAPFLTLADPPLSAIDLGPRRLGHRAAARLDRLLRGKAVNGPDLVPPIGVVMRESTDTLAVADADLVAALRLLREAGGVNVRVSDLVRASGLDRRTLERRFRVALGRSPAEAIRRHRASRAADLLRSTTLSISEIARQTGFRLPQHLSATLKAVYGQTPTDLRAASRSVDA